MTPSTISVESISKQYKIGGSQAAYQTLRESLMSSFRREENKADDSLFWALQDVSFEVQAGEVLGIIGRNGAGKSTLLKVLSRITTPTKGRAELHGRVGSLLEVGTGFHPELTGRENVFLNGAILGERRANLRRKFDEIIAFAEVEKFVDTPVKHYSSGMYVRLAFAVAAFMELEILIVDEALAVGDAAFQKKCLGKMGEAARDGRTILFVSHSMAALENLCSRIVWLEKGRLSLDGEPRSVISSYIEFANKSSAPRVVGQYVNDGHRRGSGEVQFTGFRFATPGQRPEFVMGQPIGIEVDFEAFAPVDAAVLSFSVVDNLTQAVVTSWVGRREPLRLSKGQKATWKVELPANILRARQYHFSLGITNAASNLIPYDIWAGGGTEFSVGYPDDLESLDLYVGHDAALVTHPVVSRVEAR